MPKSGDRRKQLKAKHPVSPMVETKAADSKQQPRKTKKAASPKKSQSEKLKVRFEAAAEDGKELVVSASGKIVKRNARGASSPKAQAQRASDLVSLKKGGVITIQKRAYKLKVAERKPSRWNKHISGLMGKATIGSGEDDQFECHKDALAYYVKNNDYVKNKPSPKKKKAKAAKKKQSSPKRKPAAKAGAAKSGAVRKTRAAAEGSRRSPRLAAKK